MKSTIPLFFTIIIILSLLIYWTIIRRFFAHLSSKELQLTGRLAFLFMLILMTTVPILARSKSELMLFSSFQDLSYLSYLIQGFIFLIFSMIIIWMPIEKMLFFFQGKNLHQNVAMNISNGIIFIIAIFLCFIGNSNVRKTPSVIKISIDDPTLHLTQPLRLVQISDLHIGPTLHRDFAEKVATEIGHLNPDIIAITGDLVDGPVSTLKDQVAPLLNMPSTFGTYFVTGNHEYYSGKESWVNYLKSNQINVLENEHKFINYENQEILIGGVPDFRTDENSSPILAMGEMKERDMFKILLAHQPQNYFLAEKAGFNLMICGHTHAGQFWPATFLVRFFHPFHRGLNQFKNLMIYINQGTGYWGPPLRLGTVPEITLFEIK